MLIYLLLPIVLETAANLDSDMGIVNLASVAYEHAPYKRIDFEAPRIDQIGTVLPLYPG